jgi:hypothetical protein
MNDTILYACVYRRRGHPGMSRHIHIFLMLLICCCYYSSVAAKETDND